MTDTDPTCQADLPPAHVFLRADARSALPGIGGIDIVVTSPPYWRKRDYGFAAQVGQETTPDGYVTSIMQALTAWKGMMAPHASVFLNVGDTYHHRSLAGIPARIEFAAADLGWKIRNRIIWTKSGGMPDPSRTRLAGRHEYVLHLVPGNGSYHYDMLGYSRRFGNGSNPGDVWQVALQRNMGSHLAPFPEELVERALVLACPQAVCTMCGVARRRVVQRTSDLDPSRPQAARAMELARQKGLTPAHIAAIQATGISDAGKALSVQDGTGRNRAEVQVLAQEAKVALGGYFREFTFARKKTTGWSCCPCGAPTRPGMVLDPFHGTGTTSRVAAAMGLSSVGADLAP